MPAVGIATPLAQIVRACLFIDVATVAADRSDFSAIALCRYYKPDAAVAVLVVVPINERRLSCRPAHCW
jgi:hypothetical protein